MPIDLAADRMGVQYIHNCLPPFLSAREEREAVLRSKQQEVSRITSHCGPYPADTILFVMRP